MVMSLRSKWAVGKAVRAGPAVEGAYLNPYVTDEQRRRRPIFNATLRAAAGWLFFRVARSTSCLGRVNQEVVGTRAPPTRSLFGGDILRSFFPRVSLAKPTSVP